MGKKVRFKGGPIFLNSGGRGPDDYLLKPINGGRWTLVIFRFGRNFKWSSDGEIEDIQKAKENGRIDHELMGNIFPYRRICVSYNYARYRKMKERGNVPTMDASEFWTKYKDSPEFVR